MPEGLLWIGVVLSVSRYTDCLHCFQCNSLLEEDDCKVVTECPMNQNCYSERIDYGNTTKVTLGCIGREHCPDHHQFSIVGRAVRKPCMECCMQDGCNKLLCEEQDTSSHGTTSTSCVDDPNTNCSSMAALINICSDVHQAKTVCRHYCGLCSLADGGWSSWTGWTPCSKSCGLGLTNRRRSCTNPVPKHGGDNCTGNVTQERSCFLRACPVHGEWSGWANWESCSVSCGQGLSKRHRTCTNPSPSLYGHYCIGDPVEYSICHGHNCGNLTTTANNSQTGLHCIDLLTDCDIANKTTGICNMIDTARKMCPEFCRLCAIVDGSWAAWSSWSSCSTTCGKGSWSRSRTCTNPAPINGGKPCVGNSSDIGVCQVRECPVHGGWSSWAHWEACSSTCGQGITHRTRSCTNPRPSLLGNYCFGDSTKYALCLIKPCPVDGNWAEWSFWSSCSVSCGTGQSIRQRSCSDPRPANNGANCIGSHTQQKACTTISCPVHGGWTTWNSWSSCDTECGVGTSHRRRSCSNPSPSETGSFCIGDPVEYRSCLGKYKDGQIRLVNGGSGNRGTVEMCYHGAWGTICDDEWDSNDARVACKQLGYSSGVVGDYPAGGGAILYENSHCSGSESTLLQCGHSTMYTHDCSHPEDAGVICS